MSSVNIHTLSFPSPSPPPPLRPSAPPLTLSLNAPYNDAMRNGCGLLSATKTYTESLFNRERRGKFPPLFFLFFFSLSKITPTASPPKRRGCDFAHAVTTWLQMKAPQMQFAVTFTRNSWQANYLQEQFISCYFWDDSSKTRERKSKAAKVSLARAANRRFCTEFLINVY